MDRVLEKEINPPDTSRQLQAGKTKTPKTKTLQRQTLDSSNNDKQRDSKGPANTWSNKERYHHPEQTGMGSREKNLIAALRSSPHWAAIS